MANRDVHAGHVLTFLVDDGVDRDSCLTSLAVTNDQFALATAHRHHGVNRLQTGLHRLADGFTGNHTRRDFFDHVGHLGIYRAFAVDRLTQCVDHAANQFRTNGHFQNTTGALDHIAFRDVLVFTQNHRTDRVTLEVQSEAKGVVGELQHFTLHHVGQAVDADDTVGHRNHGALVTNVGVIGQTFDTALDQFRDFCWIELHDSFLLSCMC